MADAPWPTGAMLERMGLVRCKTNGCSVYVDPGNVPAHQCARHQQQERRARRQSRSMAEMRFAPHPRRASGKPTQQAA